MLSGALRSTPSDSRVPGWLDEVLARGLAVRPEDRWTSMAALLAALGADPASERDTGHVVRTVGIATVAAFLCVTLLAALLFDIEVTYPAHYAIDSGILVLAVVFGWLSRSALARSPFNFRIFQLATSGGLAVFGLTVGGQMLGLSADTVAVLHLYVIGCFSLAGAAFERPLLLLAANYYLAFFLVARWPALYIPVSLIANALLAVIAITIFWPRTGRAAR